jgi:BMFP domain-containing protein YqiC
MAVHELLNAVHVLKDVVGPDVLRSLADQPELLPIDLARPCGREVFQLQRQVAARVRPPDQKVQPHSGCRPGGAADYVLANLAAEIDAFTAVAEAMRRRLSQLDPGQRAEVEEASRILRRARAARTLPLTDITSRATDTA